MMGIEHGHQAHRAPRRRSASSCAIRRRPARYLRLVKGSNCIDAAPHRVDVIAFHHVICGGDIARGYADMFELYSVEALGQAAECRIAMGLNGLQNLSK